MIHQCVCGHGYEAHKVSFGCLRLKNNYHDFNEGFLKGLLKNEICECEKEYTNRERVGKDESDKSKLVQ